jgi:excisionase family DNA binding protein
MAYLDTDLLKPTEVARRLGVSRSWVYEAAATGRIPCVRLGGPDGPLRFLQHDVESWLEQARRNWLPGNFTKRGPSHAGPGDTTSQLQIDGFMGEV